MYNNLFQRYSFIVSFVAPVTKKNFSLVVSTSNLIRPLGAAYREVLDCSVLFMPFYPSFFA